MLYYTLTVTVWLVGSYGRTPFSVGNTEAEVGLTSVGLLRNRLVVVSETITVSSDMGAEMTTTTTYFIFFFFAKKNWRKKEELPIVINNKSILVLN